MKLGKAIKKHFKRFMRNPIKGYLSRNPKIHVRHALRRLLRGNNSAAAVSGVNATGGYQYSGRSISELM